MEGKSSLNWLIDKRARLDGEIQKTEQSLLKAKGLIGELSKLKESLAAIDHALSLHEIKGCYVLYSIIALLYLLLFWVCVNFKSVYYLLIG